MSDIVDQKVVEMQFDNRDFEKNAKESISTLGLLSTALDFTQPEKSVTKSFGRIKDAMESIDYRALGQQVLNCASSFGQFTKTVVDVYAIGTAVRALQGLEGQIVSLTKSMSIDQISAGWEKYAEKTTSVQTIMAATGKTIDEVNESLDKLVWFSDETSYSFNDMTSNLGKFTSAGVDLETGIKAMMGISNLAALSGQGTAEASRAMYNFAQALSVGSVKLMDWKSIENANMATVEFKQTIMDTAVELGTLVKVNDKYYTKAKRSAVTTENFSSTLNEAWVSTDVLLKSLNKYGGYAEDLYNYMNDLGDASITASEAMDMMGYEVDDLGYKSFRAAQEALTFKQAVDAVKDAVSSGWSETFEHIFGNYDEARKLWTDVANELYDIFATSGNERNDLLSSALGLDHHRKLIEQIEEVGATEEEFNKAAAEVLKRHGFNVRDLGREYKSLEEYVANNSTWANPKLMGEILDELSNVYTVAGTSPEKASKNWKNLQNEIEAAGGSVNDFVRKAAELSGTSFLDIYSKFENFDNWAIKNLDSSLISETFSALADAGIKSNEVIKKNSVSLKDMNKLIDDILLGKLGVGQERIDALTKKGYDAEKVQELVNKRAKGTSIELSDLDGAMKGVAASSEELIKYYKKQAALYETTEGDLKSLAEESRTAGTEMYRLSEFFGTKTGREFIAESIMEMLHQLKATIDLVKEAWADIFPPMTSLRLTEIIEKIKNFLVSLRLSEQASENLKKTFSGLFSILRLGKQAIQAILHLLSPILGNIVNIRDGLLGITGAFGTGLNNFTRTIGTLFDAFRNSTTMNAVSDILSGIGMKITDIAKNFASLFTYTDLGNLKIFEEIENLCSRVKDKFFELKKAFLLFWNGMTVDLNAKGTFGGFLQGIVDLVADVIFYVRQAATWLIAQANKILSYFTKTFVKDLVAGMVTLMNLFTSMHFRNGLKKTLAVIRSFFDDIKATNFLATIKTTIRDFARDFGDLMGTIKKSFKSIKDFFSDFGSQISDTLSSIKQNFTAATMREFAIAVALVAGSAWLVAQVPAEKLIPATVALVGMMYALSDCFKKLSTADPTKGVSIFKKLQTIKFMDMIKMAVAVLIVAKAVKEIGSLDVGGAIKGVIGVGIVMKMVTKMMQSLQSEKKLFTGGGGTAILMAVAIRVLVSAIKSLGEMDFGQMMQGVLGIGLVLAELAGAFVLLGKNKSKFQTGGVTILLMATSVRILQNVISELASIDTQAMWRAVLGIGALLGELALAYAALSLNKSKFQMGGITMVLMAASVKIMASALGTVASIDPEHFRYAIAGLTTILAELVVAFMIVSEKGKFFSSAGITLLLMAGAVKILGTTLVKVASVPWTSLAKAIGALTIVGFEIITLMNYLSTASSMAAQALPGIGVMFLTILALRPLINGIIDLARMDPVRVGVAVGAIALGIIEVFGAMVVLASLSTVVAPVMIGIAALAGCVVEAAALIAIMGALYQIPGVSWLLEEGKKFLTAVGEAIGGFFGGISNGFTEAATKNLPKLSEVGDTLSDFMTHLKPFLDSVKNIDQTTFNNLKTLNDIMAQVVMIAAADWIYSLGNKGKSSFSVVGEQLGEFGAAVHRFVTALLGINQSAEGAKPLDMDKIKLLKECLDQVHQLLSWQLEFPRKEFEKFTENLRKFALDLRVLGPAISIFFAGMLLLDESGEATIDSNKIQLIKDTIPIITDLANTEFKSTPDEMGDFISTMGRFAADLPNLGVGLNQFIGAAAGLIQNDPRTITITQEDVDLVKSAVPIVSDLASINFENATASDLFDTQTKMQQFGNALPDFGTALNKFISNVAGIQIKTDSEGKPIETKSMLTADDISTVSDAVGVADQISQLHFTNDYGGLLPLKEALTGFGEGLEGFGEPLAKFINGLGGSGFTDENGDIVVPGVDKTKIENTKAAIEAVGPLAKIEIDYTFDNLGNVVSALDVFGSSLQGFGPILTAFIDGVASSGFTTEDEDVIIPAVDSGKIKLVTDALNALQPLGKMKIPNVTGLLTWVKGGEGDLESLGTGLEKLGPGLYKFITTVGAKTNDFSGNDTNYDINNGAIYTAKMAIGVISALAEIKLPEVSGIKGTLLGGNGLDLLTKDDILSKLGTQLSAFIRSFMGFVGENESHAPIEYNPNDPGGIIQTAIAAIAVIDELAKIDVPTEQNALFKWFAGDSSLTNFVSNFGEVGSGLNAFITGVAGLTETVEDGEKVQRINVDHSMVTQIAKPAVALISELAKLDPILAQQNDFSDLRSRLGIFAEDLKGIGENLHDFIMGVNGINATTGVNKYPLNADIIEYAKTATDMIAVLAQASADIVVGKKADFEGLGKKLVKFAPYVKQFLDEVGAIFTDTENPVNTQMVEKVMSILPVLTSLLNFDIPEVADADENSKTYIAKIAEDLQEFITALDGKTLDTEALEIFTSFIESLSELSIEEYTTFVTQFTTQTDALTASMETLPADMTTVGLNAIKGLILGLQDAELNAELIAQSDNLGKSIWEHVAAALGVASPSKVMRYFIGGNVGEGLVLGLTDSMSPVIRASEALGNAVFNGVSSAADKGSSKLTGTLQNQMMQILKALYGGNADQAKKFMTQLSGSKIGEPLKNQLDPIISLLDSGDIKKGTKQFENLFDMLIGKNDPEQKVKEAVKKSNLSKAFAEGMEEENSDEVAGFVDQTVNSFNSRSGDVSAAASKLVAELISNFHAAYSEFEKIGSEWGEAIVEALGHLTGLDKAASGAADSVARAFKDALGKIKLKDLGNGFEIVAQFVENMHDFMYSPTDTKDVFAGTLDSLKSIDVDTDGMTIVSKFLSELVDAASALSGDNSAYVKTFISELYSSLENSTPQANSAANAIMDAIVAVFESFYSYMATIGWLFVWELSQGMRDGVQQAMAAAANIAAVMLQSLSDGSVGQGAELGRSFVNNIAIGLIDQNAAAFLKAAVDGVSGIFAGIIPDGYSMGLQFVIDCASSILENYFIIEAALGGVDLRDQGKNSADGYVEGMKEGIQDAENAGADLGNASVEGTATAIDANSPSKVFYNLGRWIDEGLANGIRDNMGIAVNRSEGMSDAVIDTFNSIVSDIDRALDEDFDMTPVISPVVDLSNVKDAAHQIDASMSRDQALALSNSEYDRRNSKLQNNDPDAVSGTGSINFYQYNQSPKALSRLEIYRQTKNQLAMFRKTKK